jgi:putative nucleotidyltransferase with HDIG domain
VIAGRSPHGFARLRHLKLQTRLEEGAMQLHDQGRRDVERHRFGQCLGAARNVIGWLCGRAIPRATTTTEDELDAVVELLASAIELREDEGAEHARRVARLALALARRVAPDLAADQQFRYGCLLHDVGKLGVPDSILAKSHALTPAEIRQLEQHPVIGAQLVTASVPLSGAARDVIAFHHERWDGTGYPWGLGGAQIPLAARIFAVADRFDALTSERPYRKAIPLNRALAELKLEAGQCFDPSLVDEFIPVAAKLGLPNRQARRRHLRVA